MKTASADVVASSRPSTLRQLQRTELSVSSAGPIPNWSEQARPIHAAHPFAREPLNRRRIPPGARKKRRFDPLSARTTEHANSSAPSRVPGVSARAESKPVKLSIFKVTKLPWHLAKEAILEMERSSKVKLALGAASLFLFLVGVKRTYRSEDGGFVYVDQATPGDDRNGALEGQGVGQAV